MMTYQCIYIYIYTYIYIYIYIYTHTYTHMYVCRSVGQVCRASASGARKPANHISNQHLVGLREHGQHFASALSMLVLFCMCFLELFCCVVVYFCCLFCVRLVCLSFCPNTTQCTTLNTNKLEMGLGLGSRSCGPPFQGRRCSPRPPT